MFTSCVDVLSQKGKLQRQQEYARLIQKRNRVDLQYAKQPKQNESNGDDRLDRRRLVSWYATYVVSTIDTVVSKTACSLGNWDTKCYLPLSTALISQRKPWSMFLPALVCVSVCLSVTTITKKIVDEFVPNFMGRFLGGRWRPSSCFVTIGRGMW